MSLRYSWNMFDAPILYVSFESISSEIMVSMVFGCCVFAKSTMAFISFLFFISSSLNSVCERRRLFIGSVSIIRVLFLIHLSAMVFEIFV